MTMDLPWLKKNKESISIALHVQPNARKTEIAGLHGDRLKIRISVPPVEGKANRELCRWLARQLGVNRSHISLITGEGCRDKLVRIKTDSKQMQIVKLVQQWGRTS